MSYSNTPIVIVAYNRPKSLSRLLDSIKNANYPNNDIPLIISIDKSNNNQEVVNIADSFLWNYGVKTVVYNETNLGLRKHIIQCGDICLEFGSVLILEDDLYVSANYYKYAIQALHFSRDKEYIAGISLYNHELNVHTRENFRAIEDGFDNWYFQFASSWGQAWTKRQWQDFKKWYISNQDLSPNNKTPSNVTNWSIKSWLKYFIIYLIESNKYFLYPKISFSTNFSDKGTHIGADSTIFQVPLDFSNKNNWNFSELGESKSVYDSFFENINLYKYLNIDKNEISTDLYSYKVQSNERYLLTTKIHDFHIFRSFGRSLKPIDANVIKNISGDDIFLYDSTIIEKNKKRIKKNRKIIYNIKHISYNNTINHFLTLTYGKIKNRF